MRLAAPLLGTALALAAAPVHALEADDVAWGCEDAGYAQPVERDGRRTAYRALVLLVHTDWGILPATLELPEGQLYTGRMPTCADLDGDGADEVIAALAGAEGAWLTVYGKRTGPIASTEPVEGGVDLVGAPDLDADGRPELAWIEDPGGTGRLRVAGLRDGAIAEIASAEGFAGSNADGTEAGALNACSKNGAELIVPSPDRNGLLRVRLTNGRLVSEPISDTIAEAAPLVSAVLECARARHEDAK